MIGIVAFILGNIAVLDYLYVTRDTRPVTKQEVTQIIKEETSQTPSMQSGGCGAECKEEIAKQLKAAAAQVAPTAAAPKKPSASFSTSPAGESFINIGTGSYSSEYDWGDVPGAQVSFDAGAYGSIKSAVFEATVTTPNGAEDVELRLYNATDNHPVWGSDISFPSGDTVRFKVSSSMSLDPGSKVYKVQMKTQFATHANLDLARIHITSQ